MLAVGCDLSWDRWPEYLCAAFPYGFGFLPVSWLDSCVGEPGESRVASSDLGVHYHMVTYGSLRQPQSPTQFQKRRDRLYFWMGKCRGSKRAGGTGNNCCGHFWKIQRASWGLAQRKLSIQEDLRVSQCHSFSQHTAIEVSSTCRVLSVLPPTPPNHSPRGPERFDQDEGTLGLILSNLLGNIALGRCGYSSENNFSLWGLLLN